MQNLGKANQKIEQLEQEMVLLNSLSGADQTSSYKNADASNNNALVAALQSLTNV